MENIKSSEKSELRISSWQAIQVIQATILSHNCVYIESWKGVQGREGIVAFVQLKNENKGETVLI